MSKQRLLLVCGFVVVALSLFPRQASAYSWMIRHGYGGCATCHTDPSGGELLSAYGRAQSELLLRTRFGASAAARPAEAPSQSFDSFDELDGQPPQAPPEPESDDASTEDDTTLGGFLWGLVEPPEWLALGGSYRHMVVWSDGEVVTFPMQLDAYGELRVGRLRAAASVGLAKVKPGSPHARAAQVTTGQGDELNLLSRSHWVGVDLSPELLVRVGRINLPFGLRIPEHVAWAREASRTDRESDQQHGASLAFSGQSYRGELMAILGNYQIAPDRFRERGYSAFAELGLGPAALGASSLVTSAAADLATLENARTLRGAHGLFARAALGGPFVLLAEGDMLHTSRREFGYAGLAQLDAELFQGFHALGTGEVLDAGLIEGDARARGAGRPRFGGWASLDWFVLPHLELRIDVLVRQDTPLTLLGQAHVFL